MYNKIFTKILDSSIWLEPDATRIVWLTLIAAMDEDGFAQFASPANLAHRAVVPLDACLTALGTLESDDPNSSDPDHAGRRIERVAGGWMVLNAGKYREIVTRAVSQERTRERVRKHRETQRNARVTAANGRVTPSETDTDTESEAETGGRGKPPAPPTPAASIVRPRRRDAAWESERFYVPQRLHREFLGLRNHVGAEAELLGWYARVSEDWTDGARALDAPDPDMFRFWKARYSEQWPSTVSTRPGTSGKTAGNLAAAQRWLAAQEAKYGTK